MTGRIRTPETDPDHHVIGKRFKAWDGNIYFCDSHEEPIGYWMTQEGGEGRRTNVSERAIDRTFHEIYTIEGRERTRLGPVR